MSNKAVDQILKCYESSDHEAIVEIWQELNEDAHAKLISDYKKFESSLINVVLISMHETSRFEECLELLNETERTDDEEIVEFYSYLKASIFINKEKLFRSMFHLDQYIMKGGTDRFLLNYFETNRKRFVTIYFMRPIYLALLALMFVNWYFDGGVMLFIVTPLVVILWTIALVSIFKRSLIEKSCLMIVNCLGKLLKW